MEVAWGKHSVTSILFLPPFGSPLGRTGYGGASESSMRTSQGTSGGQGSRDTLTVLQAPRSQLSLRSDGSSRPER